MTNHQPEPLNRILNRLASESWQVVLDRAVAQLERGAGSLPAVPAKQPGIIRSQPVPAVMPPCRILTFFIRMAFWKPSTTRT